MFIVGLFCMAALLIERGSFRRVKHVDGPITIGRSSANRIVIPDKSVSERQAVIGRSGNQLIMRVLDGKQGVIVNGELIRESRVLQSGDWLQIGDARMTVQLDDPGREDISKTNGSGQPSAHPSTPPALPQMDSFRSTVVSAAIEPSPPPLAAPDHTIAQTCSVCRCGVSDNENFVACPACGLPYHAGLLERKPRLCDIWLFASRVCSKQGQIFAFPAAHLGLRFLRILRRQRCRSQCPLSTCRGSTYYWLPVVWRR